MDKDKMIVDFHALQTVPPSNINRDDTGSPKTAIYGGVQRARVSSQSWKRAIRRAFRENFDESDLGVRTKRIVKLVLDQIGNFAPGIDTENTDIKDKVVETINLASAKANKPIIPKPKKTKKNEEPSKENGFITDALFFMGMAEAKNVARLVIEWAQNNKKPAKKDVQEALNYYQGNMNYRSFAVDVALFGRMVASAPELNADASAQVAHAISVHKVDNEYDFFTAMDDVKNHSEMLETIEYNSSTLYRYATVFVNLLHEELAGDVAVTGKAVKEFAKAFITSMPTGKLNTFANWTLPSAVLVTIRKDQPINLVGAFEVAVTDDNITRKSSEKLATHATKVYNSFANAPEKSYVIAPGDVADEFKALGEIVNLNCLLEQLETEVVSNFEE
jgi:CRISPR system Cascade subunit CasC